MAAVGGVRFSVVSGGLACLAGVALVVFLFPALVRYDAVEGREQAAEAAAA